MEVTRRWEASAGANLGVLLKSASYVGQNKLATYNSRRMFLPQSQVSAKTHAQHAQNEEEQLHVRLASKGSRS